MTDMIYLLAAPIFILSSLPQTFRLLKNKTSDDISVLAYFLTIIGVLLVLARAIEIKDWQIIISNGSSLTLLLLNFCLILKYRKAA